MAARRQKIKRDPTATARFPSFGGGVMVVGRDEEADMRALSLAAWVALWPLSACPEPEPEPTPELVAASFGLVEQTLRYQVSPDGVVPEEHTYAKSSSYAGRRVIDRVETANGFTRTEADGATARTSFEATAAAVQMLARGDCLPVCVDYDPPVRLATYPWTVGDKQEIETTATTSGGDAPGERAERHVLTVGSQGTLSTPAGDFEIFEIAWQRTVAGGELESAVLYLAPDVGLVGIDRFDGASLRLAEKP